MAESVQEQGLSAGMSDLSKEHGQAIGGRRVKVARPDGVAQTQFRGVRRKASGRYGAQIWVPSLRANVTLGTFDTAEEAAKAYDEAAVELLPCTPGCAGADKKPQQQQKKKAVELQPGTPGWVTTKKKKAAARSDAWTKFRGVYRTPNGKYGAQIRRSGAKARTWLGTFESAEHAARAYDDAALKLHGARAVTNFKQPRDREGDDAAAEAVEKRPAVRLDARTVFGGVYRTVSGNYGAQIKARASRTWLGTFVDGEEAAARAYDAAAVKLLGAAAETNFEQPPTTTGAAAHDGEESPMDLLNDFPEMPALDFLSHGCVSAGAQPDDLWADLPPVERHAAGGHGFV